MKRSRVIGLIVTGLSGTILTELLRKISAKGQSLQVRVNRWLEVRQVTGNVTYQNGQRTQPARVGTRLQTVGDSIITAANSRSVLIVDTGIGFVDVAERTVMRVQHLEQLPDGGRITRLQVTSGQALLRVRRFTHPSSQLEIQTPAGWSAVRGTEFGLTVHPDGKMGVATREGSVATIAQGQTVAVDAGFQNLTIPGEPPSPPVPLAAEDTRLRLQLLTAIDNRSARVVGQIDPVNLLVISDTPQTVDRDGRFDITVIMSTNRQIQALVITPLGNRQVYELAIP